MKKFILVSIFFAFFSCNKVDLPKPNVIIIYADDLGYGDVSSYGLGTLQTPNIDKIANDGIRLQMDMQALQHVVLVDMH